MKLKTKLSANLPAFPWDTIAGARQKAVSHPDGICDLSVGTPVDATPQFIQDALAAAADAHGYPTTCGTAQLRAAIIEYMTKRWNSAELVDQQVLPVIGTKELVAWLPTQLGLGADDLVVFPTTAYPTYDVGAKLAGCQIMTCDDPAELAGKRPALIWINYPANPHGAIADPQLLQAWINYAREADALLASDECYGEFGWEGEVYSVADRTLNGGSLDNLLVVNSLSKRSNLAGYRGGYLVGDQQVITELLEVRKHSGMMVPLPVQAAMVAALGDQDHVIEQRGRYLARRAQLAEALTKAGFEIHHSEGSLYLWVTRGESGRVSLDWLAERGILAAPGDFYGSAGEQYLRIALTASDERIAAAASRIVS